MREVVLINSDKVALVDDIDFDRVINAGPWYVSRNYRTFYVRRYNKTPIYLHMFLTGNDLTDHIDCDGLNNQRSNLRLTTPTLNNANRRKRMGKSTSKYKGVAWHKKSKKWQVYVICEGVDYYLGLFESEIEAALAYNVKATELFGNFARLNVVDIPPHLE